MSASSEFKLAFQIKSLKKIYFSSVKFNSAIGIDRINIKAFENKLNENISVIRKKSLNGTYKFSQFREKLIPRGALRCPRVISIPTIRDQLTLKALLRILISVYGADSPFLHNVVSEVAITVSKGTFDRVLRFDVKDFYPSIHHDLLVAQLSKKIKKKEILHLITNAISQQTVSKPRGGNRTYNSVGIPQGLSISNLLANVYMQQIDLKYKNRSSIQYYRYVDDILIFCSKNRTEKLITEIKADCKKIGLKLHDGADPAKTFSGNTSSTFNYLGYEFSGSLITVRKKSLDNLRESIIKHLTSYKYSKKRDTNLLCWALNTRITGCRFNETKYGWMFFFSQINDHQLLSSLDHFVKKQIIRFGLDPKTIKVKRFTRAYFEITKNLKYSKYIPNYDLTSITEKGEILQDIFGIDIKPLTSHDIEYKFNRKIFHTVKDLERDLAKGS